MVDDKEVNFLEDFMELKRRDHAELTKFMKEEREIKRQKAQLKITTGESTNEMDELLTPEERDEKLRTVPPYKFNGLVVAMLRGSFSP